MNYDTIKDKIAREISIDNLVDKIEEKFEELHCLYGGVTYKRFGKFISLFDKRPCNITNFVKFKNIKIINRYGWGRNIFRIVYQKRGKWYLPIKKKSFYCVSTYDFHAEENRSDRYNFDVEDYEKILIDLENGIAQLKELGDLK